MGGGKRKEVTESAELAGTCVVAKGGKDGDRIRMLPSSPSFPSIRTKKEEKMKMKKVGGGKGEGRGAYVNATNFHSFGKEGSLKFIREIGDIELHGWRENAGNLLLKT